MSLTYYMEERALAIASEKAVTQEERDRILRLMALRADLMMHRDAYLQEAVLKRHARGEVYSRARVEAINALGPSRAQLDADVRASFLAQPDTRGVLEAHARAAFGFALVSQRLGLAHMPADIVESARKMQEREEGFANAWMAAIGDHRFDAELRERQREALSLLRTAARPMYFVSGQASDCLDDEEARELGKAWNKLDKLAESQGLAPLSRFIAFLDEGGSADVAASELLPVLEGLITRIESPSDKFPSRKKVLSVLQKVRCAILTAKASGGGGHFEVDL